MSDVTKAWLEALNGYDYEADLSLFAAGNRYPKWFVDRVEGTRDATKRFEDRFRSLCDRHLEVWYEVVFWKMFSQKGRRNQKTLEVIKNIEGAGFSARDLSSQCNAYIQDSTKTSLQSLVELFWRKGHRAVAVACVFPAFIDPDRFPMVDTRVARWANACLVAHNPSVGKGPRLVAPAYPTNGATVLTLTDWPFIESWIHWCRYAARSLKSCTDFNWRARDIEMAIFRAWGNPDERKKHRALENRPLIDLPALTVLEEPSVTYL